MTALKELRKTAKPACARHPTCHLRFLIKTLIVGKFRGGIRCVLHRFSYLLFIAWHSMPPQFYEPSVLWRRFDWNSMRLILQARSIETAAITEARG
ncbi:hypothetical protein BJI69_13760 [Luteibacter rhizovicinus DSM 16549]|uniref:Uncharacterized protein n=1 Tax=Luteibacter rhizovicinus DSM 16549 TaxID=1440763 RepID=A0A0G9HGC2_9GAMM|nr:hypothetical protein BJI69_13760 [Luteibacter rhizovicinus DSM 16549]KLD68536.1 hypothetical protein Y883_02420 [Luteibacter rhizovicinus DSM 16549]KLD74366.1 hypothetical protein Y886_33005 [Xanthomonas hyacinthi DSM 19077]